MLWNTINDLLCELSCRDNRGEVSGFKLNLSYNLSPKKAMSLTPIHFKVNARVRLFHTVRK